MIPIDEDRADRIDDLTRRIAEMVEPHNGLDVILSLCGVLGAIRSMAKAAEQIPFDRVVTESIQIACDMSAYAGTIHAGTERTQ